MIIADIVELSNAVLVTTSQTFHNRHNSATSLERINYENRWTVGNVLFCIIMIMEGFDHVSRMRQSQINGAST
jgi:hypothetical protein